MIPPVKRCLVVAGLVWATYLSSISLIAQQPNAPTAADHAKIIQQREEWFYNQRAYPNKRIPPGMRIKAARQLHKMQAATQAASQQLQQQTGTTTSTAPATTKTTVAAAISSTSWTLIGPQPTATPYSFNSVSGRVTALAVDPTNSNIVYLGGAEGGVWKTTDGGSTWTPLTDNQPSLAVGSIAIDPQNNQTIYVGTGEDNFAGYMYAGAGVLKSTDGGSTWTQLAGPFVGPFSSTSPFCGGAHIGAIAVDPANSQIILAGADFQCVTGSGIYRSTDGGTTWTQVLGTSSSPAIATSVVFDPSNGNNVYAAVGFWSSSNDGIWKSTDAGKTWTQDNGSGATAFPAASTGRISLAIAPSSPTTLYAGAADSTNLTTLGVFKTTDDGATWTQLTSAPAYCGQQCFYDNVVAVAPNDPNIVLLGGQAGGTLFLSLDGGSSWSDITYDSRGNAIHPDMHAIAFSSDGSKMYIGNDGGVWSTSLGSSGIGTWTDLNQTLALTQFYPGMSIDPTNPNRAFAGSQDNGTQEYTGSLPWDWVTCGDGSSTAFDYSTLNTLYARCQLISLYKLTLSPFNSVSALNGIDVNDSTEFIGPLTMDASNPNTLYFGTYRVYQTTDGAANWTPISGALPQGGSSLITAITVAPSDPNTVYVGTDNSGPWVTTNAHSGAIWNSIANGTPNRFLTAIAVSPTNAQTAYATFSGYSGFSDTLGHVFETTNGGTSWADISGNLPNVPVNDIVVDPDFANTLYIGTDVGVFETADGGATWAPLGSGLPIVAILSLKMQRAARILRAASYGRSAWDIQLPAPVGPTAVLSTPTLDFASQQVGTTSAAQTVTLANNSSTPLAISNIAASSDFAETNTCSGSLAAGASCTINVTFAPGTFGSFTGAVTVSDNAASGSSQTVSLNGQGFSGGVSLSSTSLSFGNQLVGSSSTAQTVTLTNSGPGPLTITAITPPADYTASSNCPLSNSGTLAAGASCNINISFAPTTTGTLAEQVSIADSGGSGLQAISLTGTGTQAAATLSPTALDFGSQLVGTSVTQSASLTNTGSANLTLTGITVSSNQFSESDNCPRSPSSLAPNGNCTINVTFAPTTWSSSVTGTVQISDNASGGTQTLNLSGSAYSGTIALTPANVSFGSVNVGQKSTQTVALANTGTLPLYIASFSGFSGSGTDFSQTNNCPLSPSSLSPGGVCSINFTFAPSASGSATSSLTINGSAAGFTQTINVSGTGTAPAVTFSTNPLTFASQNVGTSSSAQTETITNTGNTNLTFSSISITGSNPGDFTIATSGTTCSTSVAVAPNGSCAIQVVFSPTATGNRSASLSIADNAPGSPQTVALSGTGTAPAVTLSANSLTFQNQAVNTTSAPQTVTLTNSGNGSLAISGIAPSGDFAETNNCPATLLVSGSCTISITFTPTAAGTRTGTVSITDNAPGNPQTVSLSGTGTAPAVTLSPNPLTFPNQTVNTTSASHTVTLTNSGNGSLTISGITTTGDFAETDNCPGSLAANGSCGINITFTPTARGTRTGTLSIADNASGNPQTVSLSGTGTASAVTASANALTFAGEDVGASSSAQTETVTNTGNANLTFSSISISGPNPGDFAIAPNGTTCSTSAAVAPNGSCAIQVVFSPTATGNRSASLSIADNAPGSPQTVTLSGSGMDFSLAVASGSPSSMTVTAGGAASDSLTLTPEGGFNQTVLLACSGAPSKATCTVSPASVTSNGIDPAQVSIKVTTTAASLAVPRVPNPPTIPPAALWIMLFGLVGLAFVHLGTRNVKVRTALLAPLAFLLLSVVFSLSCGGGGGGVGGGSTTTTPGTPAGTYTLTVTGASGSLSHKVDLQLTVQ